MHQRPIAAIGRPEPHLLPGTLVPCRELPAIPTSCNLAGGKSSPHESPTVSGRRVPGRTARSCLAIGMKWFPKLEFERHTELRATHAAPPAHDVHLDPERASRMATGTTCCPCGAVGDPASVKIPGPAACPRPGWAARTARTGSRGTPSWRHHALFVHIQDAPHARRPTRRCISQGGLIRIDRRH